MIRIGPIAVYNARPLKKFDRKNGATFCTQDGTEIVLFLNEIDLIHISFSGYITTACIEIDPKKRLIDTTSLWVPCNLKITGESK